MGTTASKLKNFYIPNNGVFAYIGNNSFKDCFNLENIDISGNNKLPDTVEYIGRMAFGSSIYGKKMKIHINELPMNLKTIASQSFYFAGDNVYITSLPVGVTTLEGWSLAYCPNINISVFGSEIPGVGLQSILTAALYDCGKSVTTIELKPSITTLASNAGGDYAAF